MTYQVVLKIDGQWHPVVRGFGTFDGATAWSQDVLDAGADLLVSGYQVRDVSDRVVCSVERGARRT